VCGGERAWSATRNPPRVSFGFTCNGVATLLTPQHHHQEHQGQTRGNALPLLRALEPRSRALSTFGLKASPGSPFQHHVGRRRALR
jgi:hypothetical protein